MTGPQKHMRTFTGKELNLFRLTLDDICIEDIAHSLACINRFNGHVSEPINVAQHSCYVAKLCYGTGFQLQGLLHDAAEAYIGDVTKWLKQTPMMAEFRLLEQIIQSKIFRKFGCPAEMQEPVSYADRVMVRFEGVKGFGSDFWINHPDYPKLTDEEIKLVGRWYHWTWQESEDIFLAHFRKYQS